MSHLLNPHHYLLELARTGYRLPASLVYKISPFLDKVYPLLAIVLAFVFLFSSQLIGLLSLIMLRGLLYFLQGDEINIDLLPELVEASSPLDFTFFLIFTFGPIFLILWGWLLLFEKRSLWTIGMVRKGALRSYLRGVVVGLFMLSASVGISAALGYIAFESGDPQKQGIAALGGVLLLFLGWMVQGAGEEVLTRGWLLPLIGSRYNTVAGIIISSLLFALLHLANSNISYIAILNLFLFGFFACLYALYEEGLWGVFSIHSVWNWAQGNLFGFEVSGTEAGVTLLNLMEVGPDTITGGPFGPEGGLAVTVVLLVSCLLVWMASHKIR